MVVACIVRGMQVSRYPPPVLTPEEFEQEVRRFLDARALGVSGYHSEHREVLAGVDGEYEIDIVVRFTALDVEFAVLVECKHHKNPVKREALQAFHSKIQSVGAHKGVVFSTSGFQSGALEFAQTHGIATVQLADGRSSYFTKAYGQEFEPPSWLPRFAAWLLAEHSATLVSSENPRPLLEPLGAARVEGD